MHQYVCKRNYLKLRFCVFSVFLCVLGLFVFHHCCMLGWFSVLFFTGFFFSSSDFCVLLLPFLASVLLTRSLSWFLLSSLSCLFTLLLSTSPWCVIMNFLQWPPFLSLAYLKSPEGVLHLLALCFFFLYWLIFHPALSPIPLFPFYPSLCLSVCPSVSSFKDILTYSGSSNMPQRICRISLQPKILQEPDARSCVDFMHNAKVCAHSLSLHTRYMVHFISVIMKVID